MVGTCGKALLRCGVVTAIGNVRDKHAGLTLVELGTQVQRRALPVGGVIELPRPGFSARSEFGHAVHPRGRVDHQHIGDPAQQSQWGKLLGLVGQAGVERRADGQRRRGHEQGVAIGRGPRGLGGTQIAARAWLVVDDHRLAQLLRQPRRHQAGHVVDQTARRKRHHQPDGLGRPALGEGRRDKDRQAGDDEGGSKEAAMWVHGRLRVDLSPDGKHGRSP